MRRFGVVGGNLKIFIEVTFFLVEITNFKKIELRKPVIGSHESVHT